MGQRLSKRKRRRSCPPVKRKYLRLTGGVDPNGGDGVGGSESNGDEGNVGGGGKGNIGSGGGRGYKGGAKGDTKYTNNDLLLLGEAHGQSSHVAKVIETQSKLNARFIAVESIERKYQAKLNEFLATIYASNIQQQDIKDLKSIIPMRSTFFPSKDLDKYLYVFLQLLKMFEVVVCLDSLPREGPNEVTDVKWVDLVLEENDKLPGAGVILVGLAHCRNIHRILANRHTGRLMFANLTSHVSIAIQVKQNIARLIPSECTENKPPTPTQDVYYRLRDAARREDIPAMQDCIARGADLNESKWFGRTILGEAMLAQKPNSVEFLLSQGARVDAGQSSGKQILAIHGSVLPEKIKRLVRNYQHPHLEE